MIDSAVLSRIDAYLSAHKDEIVRDLFSLVRIPSVKAEAEEGAPFGKACRDALNAALAMFEGYGISGRVMSEGKYGLATYGGEGKKIGIFTHLDVVPVVDDWCYNAPFAPAEHDGVLVGRGVHDNKAGAIMALYALRAIRELGLPFASTAEVFFGTDEESGMEDIDAYARECPMPHVSLVPDNAYPVCLGEKGIYHMGVRASRPFRQILSFEGGVAVNVILGEATVRLGYDAALHGELQAAIADDPAYTLALDNGVLSLSAKGVTAHGSMPEGSLNAAKLLCRALLACQSICAADREILSAYAQILSDDYGASLGIDSVDPHFGKTTATCGMVSVREGRLGFTLDIRYGTVMSGDAVESAVAEKLSSLGLAAEWGENREGFSISEDSPAAKALMDTYRQLSGQTQLRPIYSGGGTYARHLKNAFSMGCEAPYKKKSLPMQAGHGEVHQSDEQISLEGLLESIRLFTVMLLSVSSSIA